MRATLPLRGCILPDGETKEGISAWRRCPGDLHRDRGPLSRRCAAL